MTEEMCMSHMVYFMLLCVGHYEISNDSSENLLLCSVERISEMRVSKRFQMKYLFNMQ